MSCEEIRTPLTARENRIVQSLILGKSDRQAILDAGFSSHLAAHPAWIITNEMRAIVKQAQAQLTQQCFDRGLIDATEIHEYLTDAIRANAADIRNDDGSYKPISEWPEIWQRMYEGGDVEIEFESVRSHDGEDREDEHGWEETGRRILKVKARFPKKTELLKLAMQHKGVDAIASEKHDVNVRVNVSAEDQRKLNSAKSRLSKGIDVVPESSK